MTDKIVISDYRNVDTESWENYVLNHKDGNIFQTLAYLRLHENSKNTTPFGYALLEQGKITGLVSGVIYQNYFYPVNLLTKRAVVIGGPLVNPDKEDATLLLLKKLNEFLSKRVVFAQIRNLWNMTNEKSLFIKSGYTYEDHLDIIHNLRLDSEDLKKRISKNKRNNVVKAQNRGVVFCEVSDIDEFKSGVELIFNTYRRVGLPCPTMVFFEKAYYSLEGILKTFSVMYENKIIGIRLELCYKGMVYDWYAGSDDQYKNCYPNDVLPYNILFWAKENRFNVFDFGGAGKPGVPYGVREHKLKFGGELVNYGRFEIVYSKFILFFSKLALKILKEIKHKK